MTSTVVAVTAGQGAQNCAGGFHSLSAAKLTGSNALQIIVAANDGTLDTIRGTGGGAFTTAWARAY
ncbi:MAG TPA: hypothetical protein VGK73_18380, partial [Polyangiaceae bacterium]